jgi:hypothetical protein
VIQTDPLPADRGTIQSKVTAFLWFGEHNGCG